MEQTSRLSQGDLLLIPFPFSDQSGRKVRPVIIISKKEFNSSSEDVLVVGVTSNTHKDKYSLSFSNKDLKEGKLFADCSIKCGNILKVDKELIINKIGKIKLEKLKDIINKVLEIIKINQ